MLAAVCINGDISSSRIVESGIDTMIRLASWYQETSTKNTPIDFFQIGGGIAGDFPICVVPLLNCDLNVSTPLWSYFCQISDSTTSYGSYSGAVPNEKITWGKLGVETPKYVIESDATIVAPLIFSYVLDH
jgi:deoxyhypusine synthase